MEDEDEDEMDSTQLLPIRTTHDSRSSTKGSRLANVWDEREELFDIGEDDEDTSNEVGPSGKMPQNGPHDLHHA